MPRPHLAVPVLPVVLVVLAGTDSARSSPDFLVLDRGRAELVLLPDLAKSCRPPGDLRRFGMGKEVRRVFPLPARGGRGSDLLVVDDSSRVVLLEREGDGGYREGEVQPGRNVLAAAADPRAPADRWIVGLEGNQVVLWAGGGSRDLGQARAAHFALGEEGHFLLATLDPLSDRARVTKHTPWGLPVGLEEFFGGPFGPPALADVDSDGRPDLVLVGSSFIEVRLRGPQAAFGPPVQSIPRERVPGLFSLTVHTGDFDGDGALDLVLSGSLLLFGDGKGLFFRSTRIAAPPITHPWVGDAGDLDGDGFSDLAVAGEGEVRIRRGGPGGELRPGPIFSIPGQPSDVRIADLDGDGRLDLAVAHGDLTLLHGRDDGSFSPLLLPAAGSPVDLAAGDLDGDGTPEVAVLVRDPHRVKVLPFREGAFGTPVDLASNDDPVALFSTDLDGDGLADLAVNGRGGGLRIYTGKRGGPPVEGALQEGVGRVLLLADLDGDRLQDLLAADAARSVLTVHRNRGGDFLLHGTLPSGREPLKAAALRPRRGWPHRPGGCRSPRQPGPPLRG